MQKSKIPVFSVTIHDCRVDTYRGSGKGGQNRNKRDTAVRVVHEPSGAVGQSEEQRNQLQNKRTAFGRMARTEKFQRWVRIECARRSGETAEIERRVNRAMDEKNIKTEVHDENGRWVAASECA